MQSVFGLPTGQLALGLSVATLLALVGFGIAGWRQRTLALVGLRSALRRPARSAIIVAGLMLSTVVIAAAFATGDAMTWTIRSLVAGSAGPVDEVITAPQRDFTQIGQRNLDNLAAGTLAVTPSGSFPESQFEALQRDLAREPAIAGMLPVFHLQVPIADASAQLVHPDVGVVGLPARVDGPFALTDGSGRAVDVAQLGSEDVLVNSAAASLLGTGPGRTLRVYLSSAGGTGLADPGTEHDFTVRGVVHDGGVAGPSPTVFVPLATLQDAIGQQGKLNEALVINRCSGDTVACSERATLALRKRLVDPNAAETVRAALASAAGRGVLNALAGRRSGTGRAQVQDLERTLRAGRLTDHLVYLLGDPQVAGTLQAAAGFLPTSDGRAFRTLRSLNTLSVVEVKKNAIDEASDYGSTLTSVFLVLGLFSIAASLMLVFLVFAMLAAERQGELGVARAIGLRRSHLVLAFAIEGLGYDVVASAIGALAGLGVSAGIVWLVARALRRYGVPVQRHVELRSLVIAFTLGLLVTLITVLLAAARVSKLSIVDAMRGTGAQPALGRSLRATLGFRSAGAQLAGSGPVPSRGRSGLRRATGTAAALLWALSVRGITLLPIGVALLLAGSTHRQYVAFGFGVSVLIVAGARLLRWLLAVASVAAERADRLVYTLAGAALAGFWALPARFWHFGGARLATGSVDAFALSGLMVVLGTVWLLAYNLAGPLRALASSLRRGGAVAAVVRLAVAHPLQHRFRTSVAVAMFALVVFTMAIAATLLDSAERAYVARDQPPTGYDISASAPQNANLDDIHAALAAAPASSPAEFSGVGALASFSAQAIDLGARSARWSSLSVRLADPGLAHGTPLRLSARAMGYASDGAVWSALANQPGLAVVSRQSLAAAPDDTSAPFPNLTFSQNSFAPFDVWLRDTSGAAVRLTIVGVADDADALPSGLLTLRSNVPTPGAASAHPTTFLFKTSAGRDPSQAATGLDLSFGLQGMQTSVVGEGLANAQTIRRLLDDLLEGFVGLGLISGMAALGVISSRAVIERRQEIGMLRAIGLQRRLVQAGLLIEVSLIAWLGVAVGVALALVIARNVVSFLAADFQGLTLAVPWSELALVAAVAYAAALSATLAAAWQAGRIAPAEALRYE